MSKFAEQPNDCWEWQGPLDKDGYGTFYLRRLNRRAHRVAWYWYHGEIPDGHVVNHTCQNRSCVNPQHLNLASVTENVFLNSRSIPSVNRQKTHCRKGHPFDGEYKRVKPDGSISISRYCRTCEREKKRTLRRRWRAEDTLKV